MSFEDLADRVEGNLKTLSKLVKQLDDSEVSAGAKGIQLEATRVLADADQSMKAMAREVKATPSSKRRPMAEREAELAAALKAQRDGLSRAVAKRERDALLHKPDRAKQVEEAATDKLASAASRASSNTQKLREVQGVLSDTQDIGVGVISTMNSQREALLRASDNTQATNASAEKGGQILRNMAARAFTNKLLLLVIVFALLAANGALVYVCFFAPKQH